MALTQEQQTIELITRAKRILLVSRYQAPVEAVASMIALSQFLKKVQKDVDCVIPQFTADAYPAFLPTATTIRPHITAVRALEIAINVSNIPMNEIMYDVNDGKLVVNIVPEHGEWSAMDVTTRHGADRYDLVIAIDVPDMGALGPLFKEHADFFYRTPVITIDRDPGTEYWGQINLVDLTAVASSEILYEICERWNRHLIDEDIATAMLTGMIAKTRSFRTQNVTPKTLATAAQLIAMGARREEIVHGLWRTRSVQTLKLWGKALSRLEIDRPHELAWTVVSRQDFLDAGTSDAQLDGVVTELMSYAPEAKIITIIHETSDVATAGVHVTIHAAAPYSALEIGRAFHAIGTRDRAECHLAPELTLIDGTQTIIESLRAAIKSSIR